MTDPKITKTEKSEVLIEGEISAEAFEAHRAAAARHLGRDIELPGFRKGNAPVHLIAERIGEGRLLEEMANRALAEYLPKLFIEHKIESIGKPNITVTKLAPKNPLGFKLTTAVLSPVTLPDYKAIAHGHNEKKEEIDVTEKEIEEALLVIRKRLKATEEDQQQPVSPEAHSPRVEAGRGGKTEDNKDESGKKSPTDEELPELTDEVVQKLGNFKDIGQFKEKLVEELKVHKTELAREKKRAAILDDIVTGATTTIPDILVESELHKLIARFKEDVARVGAKWEEYLEQIKKTEDDLRKEWRGDAEKNAKTQLVLNEIAKQENIRPDEARVNAEIEHILSHHKDADPSTGSGQAMKPDKTSVRIYIETILTNQKVFEFLEKQ